MWEQSTWWLVGAAAMVFSFVSILGRRRNVVALFVGSAAATVIWMLWAVNAFAVEVVTNSGTAVVYNYPALGYFGYLFAAIMALDLLMAIFQALGMNVTNPFANAT